MDKVWEILKRETPTRVDEINSALQNCIDIIENTRVLLQDKSIKYMNLEKSQEAIELIKVKKTTTHKFIIIAGIATLSALGLYTIKKKRNTK